MVGVSRRWLYAAGAVALLTGASVVVVSPAEARASACTVQNVNTQRTYGSSDGQALSRALQDARGRQGRTTLQITGVCVGSFRITNQAVTLAGKASRDVRLATLRGRAGAQASVLRITGSLANVIVSNLRITGGTGTLIGGIGPAPTRAAAGGGIYQNGGLLTLRGRTVVDHNTALHQDTYPDSGGLVVTLGAGGGIYAAHAIVRLIDDVVIRDNTSVSGQYVLGGGGGLYVASGIVLQRARARITANTSSGAMVDTSGILSLFDNARIDNNYGGGDSDPIGGAVRNDGVLTLQGRASLDHNTAFYGGAVYNTGRMRLDGNARVADNAGYLGGGGVLNSGQVELRTFASITGNTTGGGEYHGGGVLNWTSAATVTGHMAAVTGNSPDDVYTR